MQNLRSIISNEASIFVDFDGVILDTEQRVVKRKHQQCELSWDEFFEQLDWQQLIKESQQINNSLDILRQVQKSLKKLSILTKVHTLHEAAEKTKFLRESGIEIPIFIVPPHIDKNEIYIPSPNDVLVDDSYRNIVRWNNASGLGIWFNNDNETEFKNKTYTLEFLIK